MRAGQLGFAHQAQAAAVAGAQAPYPFRHPGAQGSQGAAGLVQLGGHLGGAIAEQVFNGRADVTQGAAGAIDTERNVPADFGDHTELLGQFRGG